MPVLSSYKRIITNDFSKDDKELIEKLASPVNDSFNELYFAVNGRLDLRSNLYATYKEIDLEVNALGNPVSRTIFALKHNVPVLGTEVIRVENLDNTAIYPTGTPFISYTQLDSTLLINNITDLAPGYTWRIRVIAWH